MLRVAERERRAPGDGHHRVPRRPPDLSPRVSERGVRYVRPSQRRVRSVHGGAREGSERLDLHRGELGSRIPRRPRRHRLGQPQHGVEVDVRRDERGHRVHRRPRRDTVLRGGHQPQMPRRHGQLHPSRKRAEHRHPDLVARRPQHGRVPLAADPVEHHAGDRRRWIERPEPVQQRRHAPRLPSTIHDQHHRRTQQPRHVRRRAVPVGQPPVEQPHHAFDDRHIRARRTVPEQRRHAMLADQHRIEVPPRPPGREGVVAGVDVVGADLEGSHDGSAPPERGHQPGRDGRLPAARRRCRDDHRACHDPETPNRRGVTRGRVSGAERTGPPAPRSPPR